MTTRIYYLQEELIVFLRNQNILSVSERGVTTASQSFTADGSTSTFDLTNSSSIKNVRSVTVNGSTQVQYLNYTANYQASPVGRLTFAINPVLNATVAVSYDYGSDRIYPDIPRVDLDASSYPRVSCVLTASRPEEFVIGGNTSLDSHLVSVTVYDKTNSGTMNKATSTWNSINSNRKNFQFFNYIRPSNVGPLIKDPNRADKIVQITNDFTIPNQVENV